MKHTDPTTQELHAPVADPTSGSDPEPAQPSAGAWPNTREADPACRDVDPELFFPVGFTAPFAEQVAAAKAVCLACPDLKLCLAYALARPDLNDGIWAATTPAERRSMRARIAEPEWLEAPPGAPAACHVCGRPVGLYADGAMAQHSSRPGWPSSFSRCEGSRKRPRRRRSEP